MPGDSPPRLGPVGIEEYREERAGDLKTSVLPAFLRAIAILAYSSSKPCALSIMCRQAPFYVLSHRTSQNNDSSRVYPLSLYPSGCLLLEEHDSTHSSDALHHARGLTRALVYPLGDSETRSWGLCIYHVAAYTLRLVLPPDSHSRPCSLRLVGFPSVALREMTRGAGVGKVGWRWRRRTMRTRWCVEHRRGLVLLARRMHRPVPQPNRTTRHGRARSDRAAASEDVRDGGRRAGGLAVKVSRIAACSLPGLDELGGHTRSEQVWGGVGIGLSFVHSSPSSYKTETRRAAPLCLRMQRCPSFDPASDLVVLLCRHLSHPVTVMGWWTRSHSATCKRQVCAMSNPRSSMNSNVPPDRSALLQRKHM